MTIQNFGFAAILLGVLLVIFGMIQLTIYRRYRPNAVERSETRVAMPSFGFLILGMLLMGIGTVIMRS